MQTLADVFVMDQHTLSHHAYGFRNNSFVVETFFETNVSAQSTTVAAPTKPVETNPADKLVLSNLRAHRSSFSTSTGDVSRLNGIRERFLRAVLAFVDRVCLGHPR